MDLMDLVRRSSPPAPWVDGEKIPWHEPGFSERMLAEHLSQDHDLASRREATIDRHVLWIQAALLEGHPTRILDLGCGPGLYASRLARLGHACTGIDVSPASIGYARERATEASLDCRYVLGDVREADLGEGYGLAMFLFGEINVFRPEDARALLLRTREALAPGGMLLLEAHTLEVLQQAGRAGSSFSTHTSGLFGDEPYLQLEESSWDDATLTATTRWWIVDARSAQVERHAQTVQAYDDLEGYRRLLEGAGFEFEDVRFHPSLTGDDVTGEDGLFAITARRADGAGRTRSR